VAVVNKNAEDIIVPPDFFAQTFKEIGVVNGSDIVLHEIKNFDMFSEADEGGEEEHEEMEAEQPEQTVADPDEAAKKASEVLFDHESDSKNNEKPKQDQ